jgi:CheY-like chemotaxis protein
MFQTCFVQIGNDCFELARNGMEALECVNNGRYDRIFSDLNMPRISGIEDIPQLENVRFLERPIEQDKFERTIQLSSVVKKDYFIEAQKSA